jgi:Helix-hairpin-helix motif
MMTLCAPVARIVWRMSTPGERRALIFIASVAALGVAVRGWREFHPQDPEPLAGNRSALARQIQAVDSAISVTSSKRKPHSARNDSSRAAPATEAPIRATRQRSRYQAPVDTPPRDPRQAYWDRSRHFDSVRADLESRDETTAIRHLPSHQPSVIRHLSSQSGPVDLDTAPLEEVAELPLVGPALARRIVSNRVDQGPFGSLEGLARIPGITPAFARRLSPFVTFSQTPRLGSAGQPPRSKSMRPTAGVSRP